VRLHGIGAVIYFAVERGVDAGYVIALEIIVDVCLPVAVHLVGAALGKFHGAKVELLRLGGQFAERVAQRRSLSIEIDEDKIEPFLDTHGNQTKFSGIEILDAFEFRGYEQSTVEAVGPAMVGTAEEFAVPASGSGIAGAMAAYIVKAAQDAILAPGYK
jgi:hypothetical protein